MKVRVFHNGANIRPPYGVVGQALERLVALVEAGVEYPDAHTRAVTELGLSEKQAAELTAAYDAM